MFDNELFDEEDSIIKFDQNVEIKEDELVENNNLIKFDCRVKEMSIDKREELIKMYSQVVVHDFDDQYHMNEEEREKYDSNYKMKVLVQRQKTKYSDINSYIKAFKNCITVLKMIAESNPIYPSDKFLKKVLKGDIVVNGLIFPKYNRKKNTPYYDAGYISELIMSDTVDVRIGLNDEYSPYIENETDDEMMARIFTPEQLAIINDSENCDIILDKMMNDSGMPINITNIDKKSLSKIPEAKHPMIRSIKILERNRENVERVNNFAWDLDLDDFSIINELDMRRNVEIDNIPKFKGNVLNQKDVDRYFNYMRMWEDQHTYTSVHNRTMTVGDAKELILKELLEENGWNVRNLYKNNNKKDSFKKDIKKIRNKEDITKARLLGITIDQLRWESPSKKNKSNKKLKKSTVNDFEQLLANEAGVNNFNEYKAEMSNMNWSDINDEDIPF